MIDFEGLKEFFSVLKVKHTLKINWSDFAYWDMAKSMNELLLDSIQNVVFVNFSFGSVNEVIVIDNTFWISIHLHVVQGWKWIPLLICVEKFGVQGIANNVFHLIVNATITFGGLNVKQLGTMFISMGCDGNDLFQDGKVGVIA